MRQARSALLTEPSRHGAELARSGAYAARLRAEMAELAQRVRSSQEQLVERARALRLAELSLAEAYVQRELLERHHTRFREAQAKAIEHASELEVEELQQRPARGP
jgi:post-segregation antitoxin (ccd killing protein)